MKLGHYLVVFVIVLAAIFVGVELKTNSKGLQSLTKLLIML